MDIFPKNTPPIMNKAEPTANTPATGSGFNPSTLSNLNLPKIQSQMKEAKWPFILSIGILILTCLVWLSLFFYQKSLERRINYLDSRITELKSEENKQIARQIKELEATLKIFKKILNEHIYSSKVFELLERITLPNVQYTDFNLDTPTGHLILSGRTQNYNNLARQMLILEKDSFVKSIKVSQVALDQTGGVSFHFDITLDKKIFVE